MLKRFALSVALLVLVGMLAAPSVFAGGVTQTLAANGTSALLLGANPFRHYLLVQNLNHTTSVFCSVGQTATGATTTNGFEVAPGGNLELFSPSPPAQSTQGLTNDVECITGGSTVNVVAIEE